MRNSCEPHASHPAYPAHDHRRRVVGDDQALDRHRRPHEQRDDREHREEEPAAAEQLVAELADHTDLGEDLAVGDQAQERQEAQEEQLHAGQGHRAREQPSAPVLDEVDAPGHDRDDQAFEHDDRRHRRRQQLVVQLEPGQELGHLGHVRKIKLDHYNVYS